MVEQKISNLIVKGLIISLLFGFPFSILAKDITVGSVGDIVKIPGGSLCLGANCITDWSASGLWLKNGNNAYYNGGLVGIGTAAPVAGLDNSRTEGFKTLGAVLFGGPLYINSGNRLLMVDNAGNVIATTTSVVGLPPTSVAGQTLRSNGSGWDASSVLFNNGTNVGIGTTNPGQILEISKSVLSDVGPILNLVNPNSAASSAVEMRFAPSSAYSVRYASIQGINVSGQNSIDLAFITGAGSAITEKMRITSGGSVGIGTTVPSQKLDVAGITQLGAVSYGVSPGTSQSLALATVAYVNASATNGTGPWGKSGTNVSLSAIGDNVGIGTASPGAKLQITNSLSGVTNNIEDNITSITSNYTNYNNNYASIGRGVQGLMISPSITGTSAVANYNGLYILPSVNGNSNITNANGIVTYPIYPQNGNTATVTNARGVWVKASPYNTTLTNQYGVYIDTLTNGTNNWSIYTGTAPSYFGGNVGIGNTNPDAKLTIAGASNNIISGLNHYRDLVAINIGRFSTGTLKITMPVGWTSSMGQTTIIRGYNYSSVGTWEVVVSGYNYTGGYWANSSAEIRGSAPFSKVRLAYDGSKVVILLGDVDTSWSYLKAQVTDFFCNQSGFSSGWSMNLITDETGISAINTPPIHIYTSPSGNVGIGTTTPSRKLDVNGDLQLGAVSYGVSPGTSQALALATVGYVNASATNGTGPWSKSGTNVSLSTIGDNVGIGTNNPLEKLAVSGNILLGKTGDNTGNYGTLIPSYSLKFNGNYWNSASGNVEVQTGAIYGITTASNVNPAPTMRLTLQSGSNDVMSLLSTGSVGIGTTNPYGRLQITGTPGSVAGSGLVFNGSTAIWQSTASNLIIRPGGSDIATFVGTGVGIGYTDPGTATLAINGNVGIGTTNPGAKLNVDNGDINVTNSAGGGATREIRVSNVNTGGGYTTAIGAMSGASYIRSIAGDPLQFRDGSDINMYISGTGNVGIGTTSPSQKLDVAGAAQLGAVSFGVSPGDSQLLALATVGYVKASTANGTGPWSKTGTNVSLSTITDNVGIGTATPSQKLDVQGNIALGNNVLGGGKLYGSSANVNNATLQLYNNSSGNTILNNIAYNIDLQTNSTSRLYINNAGNVGIGTTNPLSKFQVGNPTGTTGNVFSTTANIFGEDSSKGQLYIATTNTNAVDKGGSIVFGGESGQSVSPYRFAAIRGAKEITGASYNGYLSFSTVAVNSALNEWMRITSSGSVGIGTTAPSRKLDVAGDLQLGAVSYGVSPGTSQALALATVGYVNAAATNGTGPWSKTGTNVSLSAIGDNVGIGTATPSAKLEVMSSVDTTLILNRENSTAVNTGPAILFNGFNDNRTFAKIGSYLTTNAAGNNSYLSFSTRDNESLLEKMRITSTGNVGIGVVNPNQKLQVMGGVVVDSGFNTGVSSLYLSHTGGSNEHKAGIFSTYTSGYGRSSSIQFALNNIMDGSIVTTADSKMTILESGNVGIGTTNPAGKLTIDVGAGSGYQTNGLLISESGSYVASIGDGGGPGSQFGLLQLYSGGVSRVRLYAYSDNYINPVNGGLAIGDTSAGTAKLYVNGVTQLGAVSYGITPGQSQNLALSTVEYVNAKTGGSGGVGAGATGQTLRHNGTGWVADSNLYNNGTNIGIGTATPSHKFSVSTTANADALNVVDATGNVLIGSANDITAFGGAKLQVKGSGNTASTWYGRIVAGGDSKVFLMGQIDSKAVLGAHNSALTAWSDVYINPASGGNVYIGNTSSYSSNSLSTTVLAVRDTGLVGIGTANPSSPLHIVKAGGSTTAPNTALILDYESDTTTSVGGGTAIEFRGKSSGGNMANWQQARIRTVGYPGNNSHALAFDVRPSAVSLLTEAMIITSGGSVGIGTTSPSRKLDVNGDLQLGAVSYGVSPGTSQALALATVGYVNAAATNGTGPWSKSGTNVALSTITDNVGIGTATPGAYKLNVVGTAKFTGSIDTDTQFLGQATDTASAPSFAWTGDLSTGMWRPSAATIAFSTAGSERMRLIANGNVGIGTSSPSQKLDVNGLIKGTAVISNGVGTHPSGIGPYVETYIYRGNTGRLFAYDGASYYDLAIGDWNSGNPNIMLKVGGNVGINRGSPIYKLDVAGTLRTDNGANFATVSGNVGIGTTTPSQKLDVAGAAQLGAVSWGVTPAQTQNLALATVEYVNAKSGGSGGVGAGTTGQTLMHNGTGWVATSNLYNNGTNIGIGTATPGQKLDVNGVINSATGYKIANAAATAGTYLRGNGANFVASAIAAADVPILNQNTTGSAYFLVSRDTRAVDDAPQDFTSSNGVKFDFKANTTNGLSDGGGYNGVMTWRKYGSSLTDLSGGPSLQLAYSDNGNLWTRLSVSTSTWGTWKQVLNSNSGVVLQSSTPGVAQTGNLNITGTGIFGGNVGIGTTAPSRMLDVAGAAQLGLVSYGISPGDSQSLALATVEYVKTRWAKGGDTVGSMKTLGTLDSYDLPIITSSTERMRITKDGNVGIGTATPGAKLEVNGQIKITGGTPGLNKVLTSDATGLASWQNLASGASSVSNTDTTLTISPTSGAVIASLNLAKANTWTGAQTFNANTNFPGSGIWNTSGNVGIGTTTPGAKLDVSGQIKLSSGDATDTIFANNTGGLVLESQGNMYGTVRLTLQNVGGLNGALFHNVSQDLVDFGFKGSSNAQQNIRFEHRSGNLYSGNSSGQFEIGPADGENLFVGAGTSGFKNGNVGIGTTNPGIYKLNVAGAAQLGAVSFGVSPGQSQALALTTVDYVNAMTHWTKTGTNLSHKVLTDNVGIGTATPTAGFKLDVRGSAIISAGGLTIKGDLAVDGNGTNNGTLTVNKLNVGTIDPLYDIRGVKYSSFAPSVVGGVKEEVTGKIKIATKLSNGEYQAVIDFSNQSTGSDLWVWHNVIDFSKDNVEAIITPYGSFARVYYYISGDKLIFRSDAPVEVAYRLLAKRFDWLEWPTKAKDQTEKAGHIIKNY